MICPRCTELGNKSRVDLQQFATTLMGGDEIYWDENGKKHIHHVNHSGRAYRCSNGHEWTEDERCEHCAWVVRGWNNWTPKVASK